MDLLHLKKYIFLKVHQKPVLWKVSEWIVWILGSPGFLQSFQPWCTFSFPCPDRCRRQTVAGTCSLTPGTPAACEWWCCTRECGDGDPGQNAFLQCLDSTKHLLVCVITSLKVRSCSKSLHNFWQNLVYLTWCVLSQHRSFEVLHINSVNNLEN